MMNLDIVMIKMVTENKYNKIYMINYFYTYTYLYQNIQKIGNNLLYSEYNKIELILPELN